MNNNRLRNMFSDEIWKHVDRLKIDVMAHDDGTLAVSFEIHGGTLAPEEDEDGGLANRPDGEAIAEDLLTKFAASRTKRGAQ